MACVSGGVGAKHGEAARCQGDSTVKGMEAASRRRGQGVSSPWHRGEAGGVSAGAIAG
jgi:hypothetical protein